MALPGFQVGAFQTAFQQSGAAAPPVEQPEFTCLPTWMVNADLLPRGRRRYSRRRDDAAAIALALLLMEDW